MIPPLVEARGDGVLRRTVAPAASTPCTLKTCFAKSNPIVVISFMDGSLCFRTLQPSSHLVCIWGGWDLPWGELSK
jgi:hypothetical protein